MELLIAYLDAGSGSMILQALLGGVAAFAVGAKLWMSRLRGRLRFRRREDPTRVDDALG